MFFKIGVLTNFTIPHIESPFNKVTWLKGCNFIKKRLQHRCFLVNITKFLRTQFLTEHIQWLLILREEKLKKVSKYNFKEEMELSFKNDRYNHFGRKTVVWNYNSINSKETHLTLQNNQTHRKYSQIIRKSKRHKKRSRKQRKI